MWEYKVLKIRVERKLIRRGFLDLAVTESDLNELGAEGWELVSLLDTSRLSVRHKYFLAFLKRNIGK